VDERRDPGRGGAAQTVGSARAAIEQEPQDQVRAELHHRGVAGHAGPPIHPPVRATTALFGDAKESLAKLVAAIKAL